MAFVMHQPNVLPSLAVILPLALASANSSVEPYGQWVSIDHDASDDRRTLSLQLFRDHPELSIRGMRVIPSRDRRVVASIESREVFSLLHLIDERFVRSALELRAQAVLRGGPSFSQRRVRSNCRMVIEELEACLRSTARLSDALARSTMIQFASSIGRRVRVVVGGDWLSESVELRTRVAAKCAQLLGADRLVWLVCDECFCRIECAVDNISGQVFRLRSISKHEHLAVGGVVHAEFGQLINSPAGPLHRMIPRILLDNLCDFIMVGNEPIFMYPSSVEHYRAARQFLEILSPLDGDVCSPADVRFTSHLQNQDALRRAIGIESKEFIESLYRTSAAIANAAMPIDWSAIVEVSARHVEQI